MNSKKRIGTQDNQSVDYKKMIQYINLKLLALGSSIYESDSDPHFLELVKPLLANHMEQSRKLSNSLSPSGNRIQSFLNDYLAEVSKDLDIQLPDHPFILDQAGLARVLSLPPDADHFFSDIISSYRVKQGVLHNPKADRRTTKGVFHVCEGGLPIAADKKAVPKNTFAHLLESAFHPPQEILKLPFTANQKQQASLFVSFLLRPIVIPEVPGVSQQKSMEIRFFAPGNLVSNLDFVETIFGNAGDPHIPENDAALDVEGWTGHTGCVILAPQLLTLKKKDVGLPHYDDASDRQRADEMCWKDSDELYNNGTPFKVSARDHRGVIVTLIADNYFGYCKKEVKTQISYSANLHGLAEEEHAGGANVFASYDLGEKYYLRQKTDRNRLTFADLKTEYESFIDFKPEGYGVDKNYPDIIYVPEAAQFDLDQQRVSWKQGDQEQEIRLLPQNVYVSPSGYKVRMQRGMFNRTWNLVGTTPQGILCHKPCTVSGGGKSEISKSIGDAMIQGSIFIADYHKDLDHVAEILKHNFKDRFRDVNARATKSRSILDPQRSLGSVIKLFAPSAEYTQEYSDWIQAIPHHIKEIIYAVKRHYHPSWGEDWRSHFTVDRVDGALGYELKYNNKKLVSKYLRVGRDEEKAWRIFKLRDDFYSADKVQVEDDITASITVPRKWLSSKKSADQQSSEKILINCETHLFQRPDDCIIKGYDKQAESDLVSPNVFLSNYEPLERAAVQKIKEDTVGYYSYTKPVRKLIESFLADPEAKYLSLPSEPRIVNGKPTLNPRYLQPRPDLVNHRDAYLAEVGARLRQRVPNDKSVYFPVDAVLTGRRNNPEDLKNNVPPFAVYNPIHYQELPELFIDFICSITGKSPSTTGFGSEGALTKGPFNSLLPSIDLNNAFLSLILTDAAGFSSVAGYLGPKYRVDHDISLLIPEVWCRMDDQERDPKWLIENDYLEKLDDYEFDGQPVEASLLGYRITLKFVHHFMGRIFNNPNDLFQDDMLYPEKQAPEVFAKSIQNLVTTQRNVSENYFKDGSLEDLCPPLQALIYIMRDGTYEGKGRNHPDIRAMFERDTILNSDWYRKRLETKQIRDKNVWKERVAYLEKFLTMKNFEGAAKRLDIKKQLDTAQKTLAEVSDAAYLKSLEGTIGLDPSVLKDAG